MKDADVMETEIAEILRATAAESLAGKIAFPEVLSRLAHVEVERYHADYTRDETTYYLSNGDSLVIATPHASRAIAKEFSPAGVESAVRQSQRGEHTYAEFVRKTMESGCVGYFVQIVGQCAIYFGRDGSSHVEQFPSPSNP